jgi:hypothetical protein
MNPVSCKHWNDLLSSYSRHAEECEDCADMSDGKMVGDCGHRFIYTCRCGEQIEVDGYSITSLQAADHIDRCYACCGCDLCRQYTANPKQKSAARR